MGRPNMGRNKNRLRADFQRNFEQVAAVQPKNWTPIRMDVADGLQLVRKRLGFLKPREQNDVMYLPCFPIFL